VLVVAEVVIEKVAEREPAGTDTEAGTLAAAGSPLASVTLTPPLGAAVDKLTVPVIPVPPSTLGEVKVSEVTAKGGKMFKTALRNESPIDAVIVPAVGVATTPVVTGKLVVVAPPATVTCAGTPAADALLLDSVTLAPPAGAGDMNVKVPITDVPPATEGADRFKLEILAGPGPVVRSSGLTPIWISGPAIGVTFPAKSCWMV
jgi:hypothetical protein